MGCYPMISIVALACIMSTTLASSYSCNNCDLTRIPTSIPAGTTHLYLRQNRIKTISKSLSALKNMKLLDISRNRLENIRLSSFTGLRIAKLVMSYNQLTTVPHIEPLAYSLSSLDLRNNLITIIEPRVIQNFTLLTWLYLSMNLITSLPEFSLCVPHTRLSHVYIDGNRLAMLNNHYLMLSYNELTKFPCLNNITELYKLHLGGNPISTVPIACGQWWGKLRGLNLGRTRLTSLDNILKYTVGLICKQVVSP